MSKRALPLKELSINQIYNGEKATYEIPIYQRNYAWEKDEISVLIRDVYDAFIAQKTLYFIGTLVTFHKGDCVYEVIDGQQRLTTIRLIMSALGISTQNKLSYQARKKSNDTISKMPQFDAVDEVDTGIANGFRYAQESIQDIVSDQELAEFINYFKMNVHLIHYQVPKDIDLNHYFEIMNSRGEQLEKHEIIKARLIEKLKGNDRDKFNLLWENCSEMNVYVQQKYSVENSLGKSIFGAYESDFVIDSFDALPDVDMDGGFSSIKDLMDSSSSNKSLESTERIDTFQPIIDFPNFLLIVLKLTRSSEADFDPTEFNLDDKVLLSEFDKVKQFDEEFSKSFGFNLLKAKYLLDNYIVHHTNEEDTIKNNPWKLQYWGKGEGKRNYLQNLAGNSDAQFLLTHLLSMFEVSFTARQRKNYLFYCLSYLFNSENWDIKPYTEFVRGLAEKYFRDVYLVKDNLNENNTPKPGSFDNTILKDNVPQIEPCNETLNFVAIYGDGTQEPKRIPLFVFNYLDYKLWEKYFYALRGEASKPESAPRKEFFGSLGCGDFGLDLFKQFYFSRTRRSLEHYFPQANVNDDPGSPNEEQINCFGNYAMIGSDANSSGSNWSPKGKLDHYLDSSRKIRQVSVASLKFMIMMQICKDNVDTRDHGHEWVFEDIQKHQCKMLDILMNEINPQR